MCRAAMELCINAGLLQAAMHGYPEHVQEGLDERLQKLTEYLDRQTELLQGFGEAFDPQ